MKLDAACVQPGPLSTRFVFFLPRGFNPTPETTKAAPPQEGRFGLAIVD
jgi:hypothetical protein